MTSISPGLYRREQGQTTRFINEPVLGTTSTYQLTDEVRGYSQSYCDDVEEFRYVRMELGPSINYLRWETDNKIHIRPYVTYAAGWYGEHQSSQTIATNTVKTSVMADQPGGDTLVCRVPIEIVQVSDEDSKHLKRVCRIRCLMFTREDWDDYVDYIHRTALDPRVEELIVLDSSGLTKPLSAWEKHKAALMKGRS